jgi:5'(3')-deoxyribonucleotidase
VIIGLDFDGTINCMLDTWLEWLNRKHSMHISVEDIKEWELAKYYPTLTKTELFEPLNTPEFWDEVKFQKDAVEVIEKLIQDGHEIYIITSSHYITLPYKLKRCLFKHLPFLHKENIIITYNKSLIKCGILLDDAAHNLADFPGIKVVFDAPYNRETDVADFRVDSWKEFYELVVQITKIPQ